MNVSDVVLAGSSSLSSNEVTRADVLKPFVQIAYWVGRWVELGAYIALAPVYLPTVEFFHSLAPDLIPSYLDTVRWFLDRALTNPFTINPWPKVTAPYLVANRQVTSAATASVATTRQVDPSDATLPVPSSSSPVASEVAAPNPLAPLQQIGNWVGGLLALGLLIVGPPVLEPTVWLARRATGNTTASNPIAYIPDYLKMLSDTFVGLVQYPFKVITGAAATTSASAASMVVNREMSSAAADSVDTSAPKASRQIHRAAPGQGKASNHRSAQPNTAAGRVAATHADAQKARTGPTAERHSGQGHGARSAS
ncbi:hypothetical protein [Mycolicibacterium helvum]|uniref:hypothetical protein n=1 Tax=Mycolicibacterium helvum TaxID=1534349 RepID=UPI0013D5DAE0|nr:hypothetical protein [Mycolicibacterium helvum]